MRLLTLIICTIAGAVSCVAFGDWVQAHNPFSNDFRVQAYAIPFVAGFLMCRLVVPSILVALSSRSVHVDSNQ
ncbi:hypothetical protein NPS53_09730 [Pseudomonas putida]|uniref:hypothetical protein n=1 Tax=Pseudomonas putida TaxID=303 RepID=UPI002363D9C5|nr:hypothetical protein [Pseudomonas putida]MDD2139858.1 hypothetical protein [Pseudomonas putida]HDS1721781.1 hypothetical protein [Pseudomonas putida]